MASMNVLGVEFDSKLNWSKHISSHVSNANRALHAIEMIRKYFSQTEILILFTANFYSILYYNSEIWQLPTLKPELKQLLLWPNGILCRYSQILQKSLPSQITTYKHAILLYKFYNEKYPETDWIELNFNQILTSRQTTFRTSKSNTFKIGNNKLSSRLSILNGKINLQDLNMSLDSLKVK